MQFQVPQFLEIEDKIFGRFTFKEFVYLTGGAGLSFIIYKLIGLLWGAIPIIGIVSLTLSLIFYKPNDKPFLNMIQSWFLYQINDKLYIWKRDESKLYKTPIQLNKEGGTREELQNKMRLGGDKLRDLAWSLDVLDLQKK